MKKMLWIAVVLVAAVLLAPGVAKACKTCDDPDFWNPDCSAQGCTYCVACEICCPGGANCDLYCGGGAGPAAKRAPSFHSPAAPPARSSSAQTADGAAFVAWLEARPAA